MTQVEMINKFLARTDLSDAELLLKTKVVNLDQTLAGSRKELEELSAKTNEKQGEVLSLTQQLQALLGLVLDVQTQKESAAQPLEAPAPADAVAGV